MEMKGGYDVYVYMIKPETRHPRGFKNTDSCPLGAVGSLGADEG